MKLYKAIQISKVNRAFRKCDNGNYYILMSKNTTTIEIIHKDPDKEDLYENKKPSKYDTLICNTWMPDHEDSFPEYISPEQYHIYLKLQYKKMKNEYENKNY